MSTSPSLPGRQRALAILQEQVRACRRCEQAGYLGRANPIRDGGRLTDRVMLIGQAPGALSNDAQRHFVGPAGKTLERWFEQAGFPPDYFRQRVYLTAVTRCFPGKSSSGKGDRVPSPGEQALCRGYLEAELLLVQPRLVLLVGTLAIRSLLGPLKLEAVVGTSLERDGRRYLPLPHTSPVSRWLNQPLNRERVDRAIALLADFRAALRLTEEENPT